MTEGYFDLGSYHRDVQSPSAQAQLWFDRGLVWAYAFNHDEAIRCFHKALSLDPELAIARCVSRSSRLPGKVTTPIRAVTFRPPRLPRP